METILEYYVQLWKLSLVLFTFLAQYSLMLIIIEPLLMMPRAQENSFTRIIQDLTASIHPSDGESKSVQLMLWCNILF